MFAFFKAAEAPLAARRLGNRRPTQSRRSVNDEATPCSPVKTKPNFVVRYRWLQGGTPSAHQGW